MRVLYSSIHKMNILGGGDGKRERGGRIRSGFGSDRVLTLPHKISQCRKEIQDIDKFRETRN
jgi:hypothetical protein